MSTSRIDPNFSSPPVEAPKPQRSAPSTPFGQVLSGNSAVVGGTQSNAGIVGGAVFAAATREAGNQALGAVVGSPGGGTAGAGVAGAPGGPDPDVSNIQALNKASQSFSLQLLGLQQEVQDENRRFTTLTNVIKSSHDTAKAAVTNIRS